jgi:hypothetical protein
VHALASDGLASHPRPPSCRAGGEDAQGKEPMLGTDRLIDAVRGRKQSVVYVGAAALALAGAGTANAATIGITAAGHKAATPIAAHTMAMTYATGAHGSTDPRPETAAKPAVHPSSLAAARHHRTLRQHRTWHHRAWHHGVWKHGARHHRTDVDSWGAVMAELNWQTNPAAARQGEVPMADQLMPTALSGPQSYMPISPAQYANATTIVQQALAKRMGLRSAVVAVATAMQESELINVNYGTSDSLGLFQQQPDDGWGTAAQVMDPQYAADAFLNALGTYQANNPYWASQPLYQAAQAVQGSAFPYAYAQWEAQAAQLVKSIALQLPV